ncbi:hypothetical protein AV530_006121 [Patagioenas fasciata monilis]|uniref:Uncharacterized protein n=1 Tax=Patagioenas fasciata monilis TaxID=372326 RepID=A0A1V4J888_PATFA|nr:hypothetical protein AV530_006121 [Patagioenas fasciata monilis]
MLDLFCTFHLFLLLQEIGEVSTEALAEHTFLQVACTTVINHNEPSIILGTCLKGCLQARMGGEGNSSLTEKKADTVNNFLMTTAVQYLQKSSEIQQAIPTLDIQDLLLKHEASTAARQLILPLPPCLHPGSITECVHQCQHELSGGMRKKIFLEQRQNNIQPCQMISRTLTDITYRLADGNKTKQKILGAFYYSCTTSQVSSLCKNSPQLHLQKSSATTGCSFEREMTYKPASITGVSTNCCHQQPVQRSGCSWSDLKTFTPGPKTELQQSITGAPIVDYVLEQSHVPAEIFPCHARERKKNMMHELLYSRKSRWGAALLMTVNRLR